VDTPLRICAEISLPIAHTLLSRATSLTTIKRVLCHPQTAGQTRLWLAEHLPGVAVLPATSNGKAAELAAQDTTGTVAAVGPRIAGDVYNLNVLADNIKSIAWDVPRLPVI